MLRAVLDVTKTDTVLLTRQILSNWSYVSVGLSSSDRVARDMSYL